VNNQPDPEAERMGTHWDLPKTRQCLRCQVRFESEWSGERICPRCKGSKDWRSGLSQQLSSAD